MHDKREQQRQNERQCEPTELPQQQQKKATTTIWLLCYYFLFEDFEWIALQHFLFAESDRLESSWGLAESQVMQLAIVFVAVVVDDRVVVKPLDLNGW